MFASRPASPVVSFYDTTTQWIQLTACSHCFRDASNCGSFLYPENWSTLQDLSFLLAMADLWYKNIISACWSDYSLEGSTWTEWSSKCGKACHWNASKRTVCCLFDCSLFHYYCMCAKAVPFYLMIWFRRVQMSLQHCSTLSSLEFYLVNSLTLV